MKKINGLVASDGLAIGLAYVLPEETQLLIFAYMLDDKDIPIHEKRLDEAIRSAEKDLLISINKARAENQAETLSILNTHLSMLQDISFINEVKQDLRENKMNIEFTLKKKVDELVAILNEQDDVTMQARAVDISDTFDSVLYELVNKTENKKNRFAHIPKGVILFAKDIKPSDALTIRELHIAGLVTEKGSATSHLAILARAWGIPMLVGIDTSINFLGLTNRQVILDCDTGSIILDPSTEQIQEFQGIINKKKSTEQSIIQTLLSSSTIARTKDGVFLRLLSNIALPDEVTDNTLRFSSGIGLFRTEFLVLDGGKIPNEDEQFSVYSSLVKKLDKKPVIMRTFDIGADKMLDEQEHLHEKNPMLGWRGIRYCLNKRSLFKMQLKAMLRVAYFADVRILIPMISTLEELETVKQIIQEAKQELSNEKKEFSATVPLGIMVEVPSVAIMAKQFARLVDFMSIGTNDLIQYLMAADRENSKVKNLATYFNPAVLSIIESVIQSEKYIKGILTNEPKISMCGEMAGDEVACVLLLGMGLHSFSMQERKIPFMHQFFSKLKLSDAKKILHKVKELSSANQIHAVTKRELQRLGIM